MHVRRKKTETRSTVRPKEQPLADVLLRAFQHADSFYEVRLQTIEGSQFAMLHRSGSEVNCTLHPLPDEIPKGLSPATIESGYIAVAQWLVRTGRWPASAGLASRRDEAEKR
jgi:hypothetical protein